jgi:hypothetical protein
MRAQTVIAIGLLLLGAGCGESDRGGGPSANPAFGSNVSGFRDLAGPWNITVNMLGVFAPNPETFSPQLDIDEGGLTIRVRDSGIGRLEFLPGGMDLGGAWLRDREPSRLSPPIVRPLLQRMSGGGAGNFEGTWLWMDAARPRRGQCTAVSSAGRVDVACTGLASRSTRVDGAGRIGSDRIQFDAMGFQIVATRRGR